MILACLQLVVSMWHDRTRRKPNKSMRLEKIATMVAPFVSLYLWHAHCGYVFSAGSLTKHAMTVQNYKSVFSQKTEEDVTAILTNVYKLSISGKELYMLILFIGVIGVLAFFLGGKTKKQYLRLILASAIIYVTYMIGIAGMYLFSMPGGEAVNLSGFGRYRCTVFIAIYYLFLLFSMSIISSIEDIKKGWGYLAGIYLALLIVWGTENVKPFPTISEYKEDELRAWIEQVAKDYGVPSGASYLVCAPDAREVDFMWYQCRYVLWSDNVSSITITDKSQLDENAGNFDYILVKDRDNAYIQEWVEENYPQQKGASVIANVR